MDFKRSKPMPQAPFRDHNMATLHKPARYSVQRIESAKQKALTGQAWDVVRSNMKGVDWTGDDEAELRTLVDQWDKSTGHDGLNALIDNHEFSHGRHADNTNLTRFVQRLSCVGNGAVTLNDGSCEEWLRSLTWVMDWRRNRGML